jgi:hypothetical protein
MFNLKTIWRRLFHAPEEFEYQRQYENGANGRTDCPVRLLCQGAVMAVSNRFFERQRSIESVGRIVEDQDGVAGVGMEPA